MRALGIALAVVLLAIPAYAADTNADLTLARQRIESADFKASGHLVRVMPDGTRISSPFSIKGHWFPKVLRVFVQLGQPAETHKEMRENILLEMRSDGLITIRVARPGGAAPITVPVDRWNDNAIGPGFDLEDFAEPQYYWPIQSVEENVKYGARDCNLVTSKPGAEVRTNYAEIRTWLDQSIGFPVYAEKTLKTSAAVKEFTYLGLRSEQGVWSAHQVEAKIKGQQGSTLLIIERGSPKAKLSATDFSAAQLMHF